MKQSNEEKLNNYRLPDKNDDIVFSVKWFKKYQSRLLFLLNTPIIKYWFRWVMRIRKCDVPFKENITEINTSYFSYGDKLILEFGKGLRLQRTTDFRTHDKYSKRLYFAFKPLWYILHAFDWVMLDRVNALTKLSFGFSTLTQYPSSIGTNNPIDGSVSRVVGNESWSTIRNNADGNTISKGVSGDNFWLIRASTSDNQWSVILRGFICFDTSALTSGAIISATVLSVYGIAKQDSLSITPTVDIYLNTIANTNDLVNGDYSQCGTTSQTGSPISYASWNTSGYNDFTFNVYTGVSKTGISKFCGRNANKDVANSEPTWSSNLASYADIYWSARTGTTQDPKLVVTYTSPANYPMVAGQGSIALTGQTVLLKLGWKMLSAYGSFVLSGQNILLKTGRKIIAELGSFVLSGQDILLKVSRILVASYGSFILTGEDILLTLHQRFITMVADVGSFVLTGEDVLLKMGYKMVSDVGSFVLTGFDTLLHIGRKIIAEVGSFTLSGQDILLSYGRKIVAEFGSFVLTGQDILFHTAVKMIAVYGSFILSGQNILLKISRKMSVSVGSYVLTGQDILLHIAMKIRITTGYFVLTGKDVLFAVNGLYVKWRNATKNVATWINKVKNL